MLEAMYSLPSTQKKTFTVTKEYAAAHFEEKTLTKTEAFLKNINRSETVLRGKKVLIADDLEAMTTIVALEYNAFRSGVFRVEHVRCFVGKLKRIMERAGDYGFRRLAELTE